MKVNGILFKPIRKKVKIQAYLTDCCKKIKSENEVHGVIYKPDMFAPKDSYKTINQDKTQIHFCTECYNFNVIKAAELLAPGKNNVEKRRNIMADLAYNFKKAVFNKKFKPSPLQE